MAYDANPAATHNPTTGVVVPTNWLDLINSNFADIGAAWTAYTPTWTSSGVAPAIGNGVLTGAYLKLGKTLHLRIRFVVGSTTTFGSGSYLWALPPTVSSAGGVEQNLSGKAYDASATTNYVIAGFVVGNSTNVEGAADGATTAINPTSPFTWATSDTLHITGTVEVQ